ncbi:MAG: GtrA family protein [Alkalispirochaeta sp.]
MRRLLHRHSRTLFVDRADHWIVQFVRAVAVSLIAAVGDYTLLVSAVELLNTPVVWTSVAGVVFGHIITYILHTLWIFSGHDHGYHKTQFVLFMGIGASGLLVHSGLMHLFLRYTPLHYLIAKTISVVVMFLWGFLLRRSSHALLTRRVA